MKRLLWLDVAKGLAILVVVYFHFFRAYFEHGSLPPADWNGFAASVATILRYVWLHVSGLGFHAVGVFIILSGWALMQSTARRAESGSMKWGAWYRARFLRLYPMYWVAHLVYLVSPFVARLEPVDSRIVLSLLGLRFIDITMNFMYLNAAWWYFSMLIQFYLIFPLLFWTAQRLGPWTFLLIACAVGFFTRYVMLIVYPQHGLWILGGFAICRLPEFAFGMALGMWWNQSPAWAPTALPQRLHLHFCRLRYRRLLFSRHSRSRRNYFAIPATGRSNRPGRSVLLRLVSYTPTLCHLVGTSHPRATDPDVSADRGRDARRAQRVGHPPGKGNQCAREHACSGEGRIAT